MVMVSSYQYDNGGAGDGNLTQETDYPGLGEANRVTQNWYDWRDRLVATKSGVQSSENDGVNRPIIVTTYDNLDEAIETQQYTGDGVTPSIVNGVLQALDPSLLRAQEIDSYDDQGRVYQTQVYDVNPSTGAVSSSALTTNYYFDHRGDLIAQSNPGGLWEPLALSVLGSSGWGFAQRLRYGAQACLPQCPFPTWCLRQQRCKHQMYYHYRAHQRMEPTRPRHLAVVRTPEYLQPRVHTLHGRATFIQPLKRLRRPRNRRESPQVHFTRQPCRQAILTPRVALRLAGTDPIFVPCRAAILHRTPVLLVTHIRHAVTNGRIAHGVVAVDGSRLVVNHVQRVAASRQSTFRLRLPQGAILDHRLDSMPMQDLMHGLIVGRLVVSQRLHPADGQVRLGLFDHSGDPFVVPRLGIGDVLGEGDLVLNIHHQMKFVTEPLDNFGDAATP
jgi:hypothetical protein